MTKEPAADYVPFGSEWKAFLKKRPKDFIIEQYREALIENKKLKEYIDYCPHCQAVMFRIHVIAKKTNVKQPVAIEGKIELCYSCGDLIRYDKNLRFVKVTWQEAETLLTPDRLKFARLLKEKILSNN